MLRDCLIILLMSCLFFPEINGQEPGQGPGYQMMIINNPSMVGSEGDGVLRMTYENYLPGNSYNLHSVYFSYDSYFPVLHGGAGLYITDDYLGGIINDLKAGFSYSYFLQAGKDLFINAGLSASIYHRGFNFENAVLPDQIDPLGGITIPSTESLASGGKTVFDISAGFMFVKDKYSGGLSLNHLAEPDLSTGGFNGERLRRKVIVFLAGDFNLSNSQSLKIKPLIYLEARKGYVADGVGTSVESKNLSINGMILNDSGKNLNFQTGFSFSSGRITIFYNYRFNLISANNLMPFSLLHQTGLAFSLNNVDKRNTIKTINFPKL